MEIYLGIDIGTGSCKTSLIDSSGVVLGISGSSYSSQTETMHWQEQDPDAILASTIEAVRGVIAKVNQPAGNIKAISIGCALHGIMAIDSQGNPLTNLFTWADGRAAPQAESIRTSPIMMDLYQKTGCPAHGMYPLYKIMWLKENQTDIFAKTARFISVKEYILEKLCGEYIVDYSIASGTGMLDIHSHQWYPQALDLAGITDDHLSSLAEPTRGLTISNKSIADQMNILTGTPLILGASDAANSSLGAGAFSENIATCMVGTSGAYRIITRAPYLHPEASSWCYCVDENHWLVGGAINNGGTALSWLRDTVQTLSDKPITFEELLHYAELCPAGADGVICLPFFLGERSPNWDLSARAAFFGLSAGHGISHLSRAILEGVAFRLRSLDEMLTTMTAEISEVRASGGFTRSDFWVQLVADVLGRPISVPAEGETSCLGAAFWAYLAQTPGEGFGNIKDFVQIARTFSPHQEHSSRYNTRYSVYRDLYLAISPHFYQIIEPIQTS